MTRFWNTVAALPIDVVGVVGFVALVLGCCGVVGAGWHFYPRWVPRASWFAWARRSGGSERSRSKRKRRSSVPAPAVAAAADDGLPDLPAAVFRARAEAFAAQGRFAESVREWLRAIVRSLVDAGVIEEHPEWTVTELARSAAVARPTLVSVLAGAGGVFSDIWYGERPAFEVHDRRMREFDRQVVEDLRHRPAVVR